MTARRELAKRELQLQTIIDEAPVAIGLFVGPDIVVQQYNKLFMEVMGRGPDVAGKPLTDVMPDSQK